MPRKTLPAAVSPPARAVASMRPRPDAAENVGGWGGDPFRAAGFNEAAARCRGKRPSSLRQPFTDHVGFNEAAARCRGKRGIHVQLAGQPFLRFNEAAARCRGKRPGVGPAGRDRTHGFNEAAARCRGKLDRRPVHGDARSASMRLRPDAAENVLLLALLLDLLAASMRPRPDAAENAAPLFPRESPLAASMRPRPDAAENGAAGAQFDTGGWRFNEAAARCRGKRE